MDPLLIKNTADVESVEGKNRLIPALAAVYARATNSASWLPPYGPREVWITVRPTAAFTNEKKAAVVFDCASEIEAQTAFASAGGAAEPVLIQPLVLGVRNGPFQFTAPIYAVDISSDVAGSVLVEAC